MRKIKNYPYTYSRYGKFFHLYQGEKLLGEFLTFKEMINHINEKE